MDQFANSATAKLLPNAVCNVKMMEAADLVRKIQNSFSSLAMSSKDSMRLIVSGNTVSALKGFLVFSVSISLKYVPVVNTFACMAQSAFPRMKLMEMKCTFATARTRLRRSRSLQADSANTAALTYVPCLGNPELETQDLPSVSTTASASQRCQITKSKFSCDEL